MQRQSSQQLFRDIFRLGRKHRWRLNHSSLFLNFLAGNEDYRCTPWGNPTRNVFGWQRPCYLLVDEGYAPTFKALMEETEWERYGTGNNPKCANCMAHCGYEATAVKDVMRHPLKGLRVALRGPRTEGPFAAQPPRPV
jgi:hopanoid biosynthesis associated radical SAM protein HpnH